MARDYKVKQGDSIDSIAFQKGLFWETLWNHPKNSALKSERKDPDVLYPGDMVHIPDLELGKVSAETGTKHTFRRKGVPAWLYLTFHYENEPRANEKFRANIDGVVHEGNLDGDGNLKIQIPPDAKKAKLWIGEEEPVIFLLGGLDPADKIEGIQSRLRNLGFYCGELEGELGPDTVDAIKLFQKKMGMDITGDLDDKTRDAIEQEHDIGGV